MLTATATAPSHRENTAMTFAETAHKIANMVAMLTHHDRRLKMPRPAAYAGVTCRGFSRYLALRDERHAR